MANVSSSNGLEKRPKLRFPGFDEPWCSHKFSSVFFFLQNNTLSRAELDATGDVLDIHYGDVLIKYGSILNATDNTIPHIISGHESTNYDYLQDGDIIVADTAEDETVGKTIELLNISGRKIEAGLHTVPCRPLFPFASMYLGYYMNTPHYHKQLLPLMQGIKVLSISKGNISKTEISSPQTIAEQEKISRFLYLLDQRAAAQSKIIDALKKYKRGLSDTLFDRTAQSPSCKIVKLGDAFELLQNNTFSRDDLTTNPSSVQNIHYGDVLVKYGAVTNISEYTPPYIKPTINLQKFVATSYLRDGDIVFADTAEDYSVGKATEIAGANGLAVLSGLHTIPCRPLMKFHPMYLAYYFNSSLFRRQIYPLVQGTKVSSISKGELVKTSVYAPTEREQRRIASMLYLLDLRITFEEKTVNALTNTRTALLQQLFI